METATKVKNVISPEQEKLVVEEKPAVEKKPVGAEEPRQEAEAREDIPQNKGLCVTCNEEQNCLYARNADGPVLFCEMFDNTDPVSEEVAQKQGHQPHQDIPTQSKPVNLKGLCVNCENRETCTFQKPEEGVWHCEEYL